VATSGQNAETRFDLASRAAERGEVVSLSGSDAGPEIRNILCVPIRNRAEEIRAVAQFANKRNAEFTTADERALRDFAAPLGLILESCARVGH
jgi:GAF domain-containing protein